MSNELATTTGGNDAIQIAQHIGQIQTLGQTLVKSGLLPQGVKTPEAAVAIILKGRELGIPPMQALSHIHVINGKPTLSAELMLAMVMQAGHEVWVVETSAKKCTIAGKRRGSAREQTLTFGMEDAERAGVLNNPTWKKYPDAMLRARAISAFCRMFAPDVLMGASYTPEELGAEVDNEGNVIEVEARTVDNTTAPEAEPAGQYPPEPLEGTLEVEEPPRVQLGTGNAKRLADKLDAAGIPKKEHVDVAAQAVGRSLTSLTDLYRDELPTVLDFAASAGAEPEEDAA